MLVMTESVRIKLTLPAMQQKEGNRSTRLPTLISILCRFFLRDTVPSSLTRTDAPGGGCSSSFPAGGGGGVALSGCAAGVSIEAALLPSPTPPSTPNQEHGEHQNSRMRRGLLMGVNNK